MRARLWTAIAQGMQDRAGFVDKAAADKLRKEAKQIVIDAAPLAQRALSGQADSAGANLAMADIMRLQAKPAPAVKRYIETARSKAAGDKELMASVALAEAQLAMRDGKLPDAEKAVTGIDAAPDDMRIKLVLALIWHAQAKTTEAKAQVDQVIATQPDNDVALAMYKKLETSVASSDPLPPEDGAGSATKPPANNTSTPKPSGGGDDYDSVLARANKLAETNCSKAMELYGKALEQRPNGVEALTGMGYCHLDAKQFSSAFSKFRAALAVSSKFEPALGGVAETYQRQGNKEAAIEAWRKYIDIYPNSAKAKKQLEILGASDTPKEQPAEAPKEAPPPAPAPSPAPAPAPGSAG
jgi:tetratricopeptide (TPR) repeat protein